jgi:hypothetical protein
MNNSYKNINQQLLRFEKINSDDFFLLNKSMDESKLTFNICGSTKNVYETNIYLKSKMIFCNCPDSKSWARKYGVICKHSCFVLFKVLRLKIDKMDYFNKLIFNEQQIQEIKDSFERLNLLNYEEDFLNKDYSNRFNSIKKNSSNKQVIVLKNEDDEDKENFCAICYEDFENIKNIKENFQCLVCLKILHNKCINKWTSMGNKTCPYCRSSIISDSNNNYINLQ